MIDPGSPNLVPNQRHAQLADAGDLGLHHVAFSTAPTPAGVPDMMTSPAASLK
jgi:hypothetical protein